MNIIFFIAKRYLISKKREGFVSMITWFSFIGIALGVATLIVVMSVMNGFRQELFGALVNMKGHVSIHNSQGMIPEDAEKIALFKSIPGVRLVFPMIEQQGVILSKKETQGILVQGLDPEAISGRPKIKVDVTKGETISTALQNNGVLIGRRLAEKLNIKLNSAITIMTAKSHSTAFGPIPKQKSFIVKGIFHIGMRDFDRGYIFMPIKTAQSFFNEENKWSQIDFFSVNDDLSTHLANIVQTVVTKEYSQQPSIMAYDWRHSDASIFQAVKMERNVMFFILMLIIIIASFNIVSGLVMFVKDKTKDIAILRTIGLSKAKTIGIFFTMGSMTGIMGTLLGNIAGVSFALNIETIRQFLQSLTGFQFFSEEIYFLSTLPAALKWEDVFHISITSIVISVLATLYPAWKAGSLKIVDGLKSL